MLMTSAYVKKACVEREKEVDILWFCFIVLLGSECIQNYQKCCVCCCCLCVLACMFSYRNCMPSILCRVWHSDKGAGEE